MNMTLAGTIAGVAVALALASGATGRRGKARVRDTDIHGWLDPDAQGIVPMPPPRSGEIKSNPSRPLVTLS